MHAITKKILLLSLLSINLHTTTEINSQDYYDENNSQEEAVAIRTINQKKPVTLVVYIAADNNLYPFALQKIKEMEAVGSNPNLNIIVQLHMPGKDNIPQRYIITKNKRVLVQTPTTKLDSGNPQTLIDCVTWAMKHYPADNLILNLWNHGSGAYDPESKQRLYPLKFDTEVDNLDEKYPNQHRAICYDDTFHSCITNQQLKQALSTIQNQVLHGKKIGVVWMEACMMMMVEITNICKDHSQYLVASEEVIYAPGSNYKMILEPFLKKPLSPKEFVIHVVNSYEKSWHNKNPIYTYSAVDLSLIENVESNLNIISDQILLALEYQQTNSFAKVLQQCKMQKNCICFHERSYIDLRNFYENLQKNIPNIHLTHKAKEMSVKSILDKSIAQGIKLINNAVIANKVGSKVKNAGGIAVFFPERGIFSAYPQSNFAQKNNWSKVVYNYLRSKK